MVIDLPRYTKLLSKCEVMLAQGYLTALGSSEQALKGQICYAFTPSMGVNGC